MIKMINILSLIFLISGTTVARELTNEEYLLLPPAFQLDNYERCLKQKEGLYCLGTFQLTPDGEPNILYDLIKEYSTDTYTYNRTLLRRGYCVSKRCQSAEKNASLRFERCAAKWAEARSLRASLKTLHYCHNSEEIQLYNGKPLDNLHQAFLYMCYTILLLNLIGTTYDFLSDGNFTRNQQLLYWSMRANWRRLVTDYNNDDPRTLKLMPIQGVRIIATSVTLYTHAIVSTSKLYLYNTDYFEKTIQGGIGVFFSNSSTLVYTFVIISCFLNTYNLLLYSEKQSLSLKMIPLLIVKRLIRVTPLYLLVLGYSATWWGTGDGPVWPTVGGDESRTCRRKFWAHVFYVNNLVEPNQTCLSQTWYIAADMQMTILTTTLMILMSKSNRNAAVRVFGTMCLMSCLLISVLAYIFQWKPVLHIVTPETMRNLFGDEPSSFTSASFTRLYLSPLGCLPAAFLGQGLAYLHYELQAKGFKGNDHKWLVLLTNIKIPILIWWQITGMWARQYTSAIFTAAFVGIQRLLCCVLIGLAVFGVINVEGRLTNFLSWRGWNIMGRLSLPVLLVHWSVNLAIAAQPNTRVASLTNYMVDTVATGFLSYLIAVPLTILVEMPMQKFLDSILSKLVKKPMTKPDK